LDKLIFQFALLGRGIARPGDEVCKSGRKIGYVTSGTMVPYWKDPAAGQSACRAIGMALLDCETKINETVEISVRGKEVPAILVEKNLTVMDKKTTQAVIAEV
jgi:aminomethyltransferase